MKKKLFYISSILFLSFIIVLLYQFRFSNNESNGFERNFQNKRITLENIFQLPLSPFYFAGISKDSVFFKNSNNVGMIYSINYNLSSLISRDLNIPKDISYKKTKVSMGVIDSLIYICENSSGKLTIVSKSTGRKQLVTEPKVRLKHSRLISTQAIVGRGTTFNTKDPQNNLTKINYRLGSTEKIYPLEKEEQKDSYFSNDGMLNFDPVSAKIFYVYFYRNEFICLDTNLKLQYKSKTIDTIRTAVVNISETKKDKRTILTQSKPSQPVNRNFIIYKNSLYIMSAIKSDNENLSDFRRNQVIDVYSIDHHGKYLYSFYIPKHLGKKLREFKISGQYIFATYDNLLIKYRLLDNIT